MGMKNSSNNGTNNLASNETMAQRHTRLFNTVPMAIFLAEVADDWQVGDMALSRMESVMYSCRFLTKLKGYKKFFGKLERVGRLGKGHGFNPAMGKVTPNEIHAYLVTLIDFLEENDWTHLTADQLVAIIGEKAWGLEGC